MMRIGTMLLAVAALYLPACRQTRADQSALPSPSGSALPAPDVPSLPRGEVAAGADERASNPEGSYRGTGTLRAREKAELAAKSSGVISAIDVHEGDRVKKGQLLFRVDGRQATLAVAQTRAALDAAKVLRASAELEFQRTKQLFDQGAVAMAAYDQAKAQYDSAEANLRQAEVALSQAQRGAGDTAVHAPFDGIVTEKLKSEGEMATTTPPSVVLVLQDIDVVELRSRMPERALRHLAPGNPLKVSLPALGVDKQVSITRINPTIDVRTRTVEVVAEIPNPDGSLKPGMLAEVEFKPGAGSHTTPVTSASNSKAP